MFQKTYKKEKAFFEETAQSEIRQRVIQVKWHRKPTDSQSTVGAKFEARISAQNESLTSQLR